jgi:hypothetical protein
MLQEQSRSVLISNRGLAASGDHHGRWSEVCINNVRILCRCALAGPQCISAHT